MNSNQTYLSVRVWLVIGMFMLFIQVIVGGITRLTESGLSITKWEVVSGTIPPLSEDDWKHEFDLYKETPQYREINEGMSLEDFKFIYFWEYIHRFWARFMGFVFLIPFLYFWHRKMISKQLMKDLFIVILLACLAATFGWIMVASGLVQRPWVNAYKLSLHLMIAMSVLLYLLWTYLRYISFTVPIGTSQAKSLNKWLIYFSVFLFLQVFLGGILSGMRAAVAFPTWPDMYGEYIPRILLDNRQWSVNNILWYDQNAFMPALVHFLHRNCAYLVFIVGCVITFKLVTTKLDSKTIVKKLGLLLISAITLQVVLGIVTVLQSVGEIPVLWGVLHQAGALVLTASTTLIIFGTTSVNTIK